MLFKKLNYILFIFIGLDIVKLESEFRHNNNIRICTNSDKEILLIRTNKFDSPKQDSVATLFVYKKENLEMCLQKCCEYNYCDQIIWTDYHCYGYSHMLQYIPSSSLTYSSDNFKRVRRKRTIIDETFKPKLCIYGLKQCSENEFCKRNNDRRRNGICACIEGYERNITGVCELNNSTQNTNKPYSITSTPKMPLNTNTSSIINTVTPVIVIPVTTSKSPTESTIKTVINTDTNLEKLIVNISNKTVTLPAGSIVYENWVTLSAYALVAEESAYKFTWSLVDKPDSKEEGVIRDTSSPTISLSNLVPGVYIFKVSVTGDHSAGEAMGNVTVLPAEHNNKAPVAKILPSSQTVKLPNSGVVLDGSGSTDDKKIVSFEWELVMGPLGYKLTEKAGSTLQMIDLVPGNYTVMLKVKDEEGLEGNTTASIFIVKETDYPPTSNAGGDKIIYLPQTEITLNGNMSTDDHGIVEWEWTKGPEDSGNAVDMQDTRSPQLHLSDLEEGHYHFILKVVDTAGQRSNSSVHLYVRPSSDNVLKANAGLNVTVVIPNTTVLLDGSSSTGVSTETNVLWKQISGPNTAHLSAPDALKCNASELTRGSYVFELSLWSGDGKVHNSSSNITVTVNQDKNLPPVANAGGDFGVTLPASVVIVNGSRSSDDVGVVRFLWQRDLSSLAAGTVVRQSDKTAVLLFTGVVPGRYVWNLTVWDDQGASSTDTVSIIVKEGANALDEVEIVVGVSIDQLSVNQLNNFIQKLQLLLHNSTSDTTLTLIDIYGRRLAGQVSLIVLGKRGGQVVRGTSLVRELKSKTMSNYRDNILNLPLLNVDTVICQNNCSGHGECIQSTKECRCQSWWMESFLRRRFGESVPNCDWSVVYVFVIFLGLVVFTVILVCLLYHFAVRRFSLRKYRKPKPQQYSLLDNFEGNCKAQNRINAALLDTESDSDTNSETEIFFEARSRRQRAEKQKNGVMRIHKLRT